jgi:hypothetical protein
MATTSPTLGEQMAAAIDRQLTRAHWKEGWGDELSDGVFDQAYAELSERGIPVDNIELVLERTRQLRDAWFGPGGPLDDGDMFVDDWKKNLRPRLLGYFAMCKVASSGGTTGRIDKETRVQFDDETRTITVDRASYEVVESIMYRVWKVVYEHIPGKISEAEIMKKLNRTRVISISQRRSKIPEELNEMLIGTRSAGYEIRLPPISKAAQKKQ